MTYVQTRETVSGRCIYVKITILETKVTVLGGHVSLDRFIQFFNETTTAHRKNKPKHRCVHKSVWNDQCNTLL